MHVLYAQASIGGGGGGLGDCWGRGGSRVWTVYSLYTVLLLFRIQVRFMFEDPCASFMHLIYHKIA